MKRTIIPLSILLILAALAAFVVPKITGTGCTACISPVKLDIARIASLLDQFQLDCHRYPTTDEGLDALINAPIGLERKWKGPYANEPIGNDPWGNPYRYEADGKGYTLTSLGKDGRPGGENADRHEQG